VGIQARLRVAIISPVSTRCTPGTCHARLVSIDLIRVRHRAAQDSMCSMPGSVMSSM
jgi:hypothetical protein